MTVIPAKAGIQPIEQTRAWRGQNNCMFDKPTGFRLSPE